LFTNSGVLKYWRLVFLPLLALFLAFILAMY
jgi:uncharacterized protein YpmS